MEKKYLYEELKEIAFDLNIQKKNIPKYILDNIKYPYFEWQKEAVENFLLYENIKEIQNIQNVTHLMFNMATGTGKTLIMASLILYYYKKGYRHFLFFVNQNNIIDKTEINFLDKYHLKYLFNEKIIIDNKEVNIFKVDNFSDHLGHDIEIKFTTIQKLYNDIYNESENQTTLDELVEKNIVMIADEAHHLNSDTKKRKQLKFRPEELGEKSSNEDIEKFGWEHTIINLLLHKKGSLKTNKNVLLEFSATIPTNIEVQKKYEKLIISKFDLKEFLKKGYTKEINLISSTLNKKERILHSLLLNWYRVKIALKYRIPNFKPVILFRSKTILESKNDYQLFLNIINNLSLDDYNFFQKIDEKIQDSSFVNEQGKSITIKVLNSINYNFNDVIKFIKDNFQARNCIITNSESNKAKNKEKTEDYQDKLLNSLEDKNNHIRAIFTVDRLTEGWDVLNLFDIVRLYEEQPTGGSTQKTPDSTVKEKQLIGRGVRYYPFIFKDKISNKRKFDDNLDHELRVLEELFYYTYDEGSRYISHLKNELKRDGYIDDDRIYKEFKLKDEFKQTEFYKKVKIIGNKQISNPVNKKKILSDLSKTFFKQYEITELGIYEDSQIFINSNHVSLGSNIKKIERIKVSDFEKHIFKKALNIKINSNPEFFKFSSLKNRLDINSFDELQSPNVLGNFIIELLLPSNITFSDISNDKKLKIILKFLEALLNILEETVSPKLGSEFNQWYSFEELFGGIKKKAVKISHIAKSKEIEYEFDLKNSNWYLLNSFVGTSEERALIKFVGNTIKNLEKKYEKIYFLRNEEIYKIYDFEKGRGFQPDFLMFLKEKEKESYYQIFIESKGDKFIEPDIWKDEFLKDISEKYSKNQILRYKNDEYYLIGLPFSNENNNDNFKNHYLEILE